MWRVQNGDGIFKSNALKNSSKGLDVVKAANYIKKIALARNPKTSYTLGKDAFFAKLLSYLPQDIINRIVKYGLKCRLKG